MIRRCIILNQPVIKWSGSKRSQAKEIIKYFPKEIDAYYEPFCGGASVLKQLFNSNINIKKYVCSDINNDLINLWKIIKKSHKELKYYYRILWNQLNCDNDIERKKEYFNNVRDRFNKQRNPFDFMFIMRTTTNDMPRYNKNGEFNNSFHVTRNGIQPDKLDKIIDEWSFLLNKYDVEFVNKSFEEIIPEKEDFLYLDPPYYNTKGMYYGVINYDLFFEYLRSLKCDYIFSFDGISGNDNKIFNVPKDIYNTHKLIYSGNSSFKRTIGKSNNSIVYESLYIKRK